MSANEKMMSELSDSTGVYIAPGTDAKFYLQCLSDDIIKNQCEPFLAKAVVVAPGFPDLAEGSFVEGWCVARKDGYWLVYHPGNDVFYCFWGSDVDDLGAHGVCGAPLYCWSA